MNISIIDNRGPKRACGVPGCRHIAKKLVLTNEHKFGLCEQCYQLFLSASKHYEQENDKNRQMSTKNVENEVRKKKELRGTER